MEGGEGLNCAAFTFEALAADGEEQARHLQKNGGINTTKEL